MYFISNKRKRELVLNIAEAKAIVGNISKTTKMPCYSYNLPAWKCNVGAKLREIKGSVCHGCYAMKGFYMFPKNKLAMENRIEAINKSGWVDAMVFLINHYLETKAINYFRWHDSGDLQNYDHLMKIISVANKTPKVKHWLPTREIGLISRLIKSETDIPKNLVIRISDAMIDGKSIKLNSEHIVYSGVHSIDKPKDVFVCPAPKQDNECKECRACWNKKIDKVSYHKH